jgi:hypothetical protein
MANNAGNIPEHLHEPDTTRHVVPPGLNLLRALASIYGDVEAFHHAFRDGGLPTDVQAWRAYQEEVREFSIEHEAFATNDGEDEEELQQMREQLAEEFFDIIFSGIGVLLAHGVQPTDFVYAGKLVLEKNRAKRPPQYRVDKFGKITRVKGADDDA